MYKPSFVKFHDTNCYSALQTMERSKFTDGKQLRIIFNTFPLIKLFVTVPFIKFCNSL